ncbi:restriction endonuclease subunit S [Maribacter hydrothermalis]|nr:restriction endonuclease subunit S [Maribacter hydrothermalis]
MQSKNIGQIAEVIAGQSPPSDSYNEIEEGLPFYQGKTDFGDLNPIPRKWCTNPTKTAEVNDILMSVRAPVGPVNLANEKACIGRGLGAIRAKGLNDFRYIYYFLKNNQELVSRYATGSTFKSISKGDIEKIRINVPKDSIDQKRIAQVLTDCENLITNRKKSIALLDELLRSTFLEMFGNPMKNTKGWKKDSIKKTIGSVVTGNTPPRKNLNNYSLEFIEWIKTDNIVRGEKNLTKAKEFLSETGSKLGRIVSSNTLLVACIAGSEKSIGNCALTDRKVSFNQQINAIIPFDDVHPEFLYWMFVIFEDYIKSHATKGMKKIITKGEFEKIKLFKPDFEKQTIFAKISENVEETKKLYQRHLTELENLYGRLSQDAFKGQLDLSKVVLREEFLRDVAKPAIKENLDVEKESKNSKTFSKTLFDLDKIDTYLENLIKSNFGEENFVFDDIKDLLFQDFKIQDYQDEYDTWKANFFNILKKENSQIEQYFDIDEGRIKFKLKDEIN